MHLLITTALLLTTLAQPVISLHPVLGAFLDSLLAEFPLLPASGLANHTIHSNGLARQYMISVPSDYSSSSSSSTTSWPLILDFHGRAGSPWQQYANSQYDRYAAGRAYIVVYPAGVDGAWQGPSYARVGVDDIEFTKDLLEHLKSVYRVDENRVYASGKSNGGGFVDLLACSWLGDEFAGFAMAAAALYTDLSLSSCDKRRAVLEAHGGRDTTVPYGGTESGRGGRLPDVGKWVGWWARRSCGEVGAEREVVEMDGYSRTSYSCGGLGGVVQHHRVPGLGHCWPSSGGENWDYGKISGGKKVCDDLALDFTPVVLDFFSRWTLANAPKE